MDQQIEDLLEIWEDRQLSGNPVAPEELCQHCPQLLDELRQQIRILNAVTSNFGVICHSQPTSDVVDRSSFPDPRDSPNAAGNELLPGQILDVGSRFRVRGFHARGGLGSVYAAVDLTLNRRVAIKVPRRGQRSLEAIQRFEQEARVTGSLDHPGIVPVYSMTSAPDGRPFYVMRFVEGETLQQSLATLHREQDDASSQTSLPSRASKLFYRSLRFRHVLQQFVAVCNIVAYTHEQQVIHRDIKPSNILLGRYGEVLLLDWGLARRLIEAPQLPSDRLPLMPQPGLPKERSDQGHGFSDPRPTQTGQMLGTPAFASPEQLFGQTDRIDQRSDIYSLGVTLLVLLTGRLPFEQMGLERYLDRLTHLQGISPYEYNTAVPPALEAICRRAMAPCLKDRYSDVRLLTIDLERWLNDESVSVLRDTIPDRAARFFRRRTGLAAALFAALSVSVISGLTGSMLLRHKNVALSAANHQLGIAVAQSQEASAAALTALRSLCDDVIARKFTESSVLSPHDRQFLENIQRQFESLADLQGDALQSRIIRAEGSLLSGQIMRILSQQQEARLQFEAAAQRYHQLAGETPSPEIQAAHLDAVSHLVQIHREFGEMTLAERNAREGLRFVEQYRPSAPEKIRVRLDALNARLCQELSYLFETQERYEEAAAENRRAIVLLEQLHSKSPKLEYQLSLARNYRALGEMSRFLKRRDEMQQCSRLAVATCREVLAADPDSRRNHLEFGWALYDASFIAEEIEGPAAAEPLLNEGIDYMVSLQQRFPLVAEYQSLHATLLHRRAAMRQLMPGRTADAIADLTQCIHIFHARLHDPGTYQNARPALRALHRLLRIHREQDNSTEALAAAVQAAQFCSVYLAQYPRLAEDSELRAFLLSFAEELKSADPVTAETLFEAARRGSLPDQITR